jgi:hypothetical protein
MNNPAASSGVSTKETINFIFAIDGILNPRLPNNNGPNPTASVELITAGLRWRHNINNVFAVYINHEVITGKCSR